MGRTKPTVNRIPITKARINLGAIVKRAHLNGEYFIVEKDGIPIAGILDVDELEDYLELRNPEIQKQIAESRADYEAGRVRDVREFIAELRAGGEREKAPPPKRA